MDLDTYSSCIYHKSPVISYPIQRFSLKWDHLVTLREREGSKQVFPGFDERCYSKSWVGRSINSMRNSLSGFQFSRSVNKWTESYGTARVAKAKPSSSSWSRRSVNAQISLVMSAVARTMTNVFFPRAGRFFKNCKDAAHIRVVSLSLMDLWFYLTKERVPRNGRLFHRQCGLGEYEDSSRRGISNDGGSRNPKSRAASRCCLKY